MSIDLMSSHQDHHVNDEFYKWLDKKYGRVGKVAGHHGNIHDYLGVYYKYYANTLILDMILFKENGGRRVPSQVRTKRKSRYTCTRYYIQHAQG